MNGLDLGRVAQDPRSPPETSGTPDPPQPTDSEQKSTAVRCLLLQQDPKNKKNRNRAEKRNSLLIALGMEAGHQPELHSVPVSQSKWTAEKEAGISARLAESLKLLAFLISAFFVFVSFRFISFRAGRRTK